MGLSGPEVDGLVGLRSFWRVQGLSTQLAAGVAAITVLSIPRAASLAISPSWTPSPLLCGSSCFLPTLLSAVSFSWLPGEWTTCYWGRGWGESPAHRPPALSLHRCHGCPIPAFLYFLPSLFLSSPSGI